ncbi:MAG: hypothetical protein H0W44_02055 [Gammaproteobacteria bacterium]|nr:hypothetical protein [Gammaproteobacteria bacterium]
MDNAVAESFSDTLKTEWIGHEDYKTKSDAKQSLFEYTGSVLQSPTTSFILRLRQPRI